MPSAARTAAASPYSRASTGQPEAVVGVDGVRSEILGEVRPQLVQQADAAAFVTRGVDEHATLLGSDEAQAVSQLDAAVAPQRAERIAGEALRVQADQHVGMTVARSPMTSATYTNPDGISKACASNTPDGVGKATRTTSVVSMRRGRFYPRVTGGQTAPVTTARSLWFVAPRELEIRETLLPSLADGQVARAHGVLRDQCRHRDARLPRAARRRHACRRGDRGARRNVPLPVPVRVQLRRTRRGEPQRRRASTTWCSPSIPIRTASSSTPPTSSSCHGSRSHATRRSCRSSRPRCR